MNPFPLKLLLLSFFVFHVSEVVGSYVYYLYCLSCMILGALNTFNLCNFLGFEKLFPQQTKCFNFNL